MRYAEPKLFDLNPISVNKFYKVIIDFTNLNKIKSVDDLRKVLNDRKYNIEEKYYITTYLPKYFDYKNEKSIIRTKIKELEDSGDMEDIKDSVDKVNKYVSQINDECKTKAKIYKRQYSVLKKSIFDIEKHDNSIKSEIKIWKKLPVKKSFKEDLIEFIINELTPFFSKENIMKFIENTFQIEEFDQSAQLLYLEYSHSKEIYSSIRNIHSEYCKYTSELEKDYNSNEKKLEIPYSIEDNDHIKEMKGKQIGLEVKMRNDKQIEINNLIKRNEFKDYNKTYLRYSTVRNFAKIMFFSFPKIREKYLVKRENITLNSYLKNVAKNI